MAFKRTIGAALLMSSLAFPTFADHHEHGEHAQHAKAPASLAAAAISVADLDKAQTFYTQHLGMSVVRSSATSTYKEVILATDDTAGAKLVVIQSLTGTSSIGPARIVFNTDDAAAMIAGVKAGGGTVEREAKAVAPNVPMIIGIGHDPDGNTLEFIQR